MSSQSVLTAFGLQKNMVRARLLETSALRLKAVKWLDYLAPTALARPHLFI